MLPPLRLLLLLLNYCRYAPSCARLCFSYYHATPANSHLSLSRLSLSHLQALGGEDITIYGDGMQTRSFCFVEDEIDGLIRFMNNPSDIGPMNIGNPVEFTIKELAEKVIKHTGSGSKIVHKPLPGDDPKQRRPDITRAREIIKWEPTVGLDEGLRRTIEYFQRLDLRKFKKPTSHDAHKNTERDRAAGRDASEHSPPPDAPPKKKARGE